MEGGHQLLDLIHKDREWLKRGEEEEEEERGGLGVVEEKKLELRLAPPGEDWFINEDNKKDQVKSFSSTPNKNKTWLMSNNGGIFPTPWNSSSPSVYQMKTQQQPCPSYLQFQSHKAMESSTNPCCTKGVTELQQSQAEKKACSQPSAATVPANTAVTNISQKRSAPAPVVGWPPVRSFRKNLANSKQVLDSQNENPPKELNTNTNTNTKQEICSKGMFVKINMDGVPIGRKVDLKAYDSYDKLSSAVDELFRGLLAAQRDSPATGNQNTEEDVKEITGLLDGSGEYTLVYEDNEGDRMLVGDVPWDMFASTVKRLRVLKSSELSALRVGSGKQGKTPQ